jgi:hypothetical protein
MRRGQWHPTISTRVRNRDGLVSWLKVACMSKEDAWFQAGEMTAATIAGAPKPDILCDFEWTAGGRKWHATQFSLAPSLAVLGQQSIGESPLSIDDQWLIELKQAIDAVNKTPLSGWHIHPGRVARVIGQRFGSKAPYAVDEWQTAHGDLNWGNVTAPHLMLLDWEFWARPREGSMPPRSPRGFDAAALPSHSLLDRDLYRRIETVFAEDQNTPSGVVASLYRFARTLDRIEAGFRDPREHRIAAAEARRRLRL